MCTLHSFPHNIDHCLTWARSEFEGLLEKVGALCQAWSLHVMLWGSSLSSKPSVTGPCCFFVLKNDASFTDWLFLCANNSVLTYAEVKK